jgi:hypothetical protein
MSEEQAGFTHWELTFDEKGAAVTPGEVNTFVKEQADQNFDDLFIFSHGWNNDQATARDLYLRFFAQMRQVLLTNPPPKAKIGTVGIIWPSMRWVDEALPARTGGAQSLQAETLPPTDDQLILNLKPFFTGAQQQAALDTMAALLKQKAKTEAALHQYYQALKDLLAAAGTGAAEDNGERLGLFGGDPMSVFKRFASLAPQRRVGGAAGFGDIFTGLWNGAKEVARVGTYWEMKNRAGVVGQVGLGPILERVRAANPNVKVHLIGHSFGARLVSNSLVTVRADPPHIVGSVFLLQGAFSHFAFAPKLPQDPNRAGALAGMNSRVDGPLCVTHSLRDTAVGTAYPLASLVSRDDSAALSDAFYRWGGMGHDGAQAVGATADSLRDVGTKYAFGMGTFLNLDGNSVITQGGPPSGAHSDIVHPQIAWAVLAAAHITGA